MRVGYYHAKVVYVPAGAQVNFSFLKLIISFVFSFHSLNFMARKACQKLKGLISLNRGFSLWHRAR